jgi:UrcA family protein
MRDRRAVVGHTRAVGHFYRETTVETNAVYLKVLCIGWFYIGAVGGSLLFPPTALSNDAEVRVRISVSTGDIDLSQPAGVRRLYGRLRDAARIACRDGDRVGLEPVADFTSCFEKSLGEAVRSINRQPLTQLYLQTHTLQDATALGIDTRQWVLSYLTR